MKVRVDSFATRCLARALGAYVEPKERAKRTKAIRKSRCYTSLRYREEIASEQVVRLVEQLQIISGLGRRLNPKVVAKRRSVKYIRRTRQSKPYHSRKRCASLTVDACANSSDSYVDDNISDVCKALLMASGPLSASDNLRSSLRRNPFSDQDEQFSFNKTRNVD